MTVGFWSHYVMFHSSLYRIYIATVGPEIQVEG